MLGNEVDKPVMTTMARITLVGLVGMGTQLKLETR